MKHRSKILYPIKNGVPLSLIKKTYNYIQLQKITPITEETVWELYQQVINEQLRIQGEFVLTVEKIWEEGDCSWEALDTTYMRQNVLRSLKRGVRGVTDGQELTEWDSSIKSPRIQKS